MEAKLAKIPVNPRQRQCHDQPVLDYNFQSAEFIDIWRAEQPAMDVSELQPLFTALPFLNTLQPRCWSWPEMRLRTWKWNVLHPVIFSWQFAETRNWIHSSRQQLLEEVWFHTYTNRSLARRELKNQFKDGLTFGVNFVSSVLFSSFWPNCSI